jgi:hypothetical protein
MGSLSSDPGAIPSRDYEERYWNDLQTEDWPSLLPLYERD